MHNGHSGLVTGVRQSGLALDGNEVPSRRSDDPATKEPAGTVVPAASGPISVRRVIAEGGDDDDE